MTDDPYIRFRCTRCTHALKVKAPFAGRKVYCPACYKELTVPAVSAPDRRAVSPDQLYVVDSMPRDTRQMADRFAFAEVDCPLCGTKIAVRENQIGSTVECPDCGTKVSVTKEKLSAKNDYLAKLNSSSGPDDPAAKRAIDPNGVYGVDTAYTPPKRSERIADDKKKFAVHCPLCETLQYADESQVGTKFRCPDCETEFVVRKPFEPKPPEPVAGSLRYEGGTVYGISGESRPLLNPRDRTDEGDDPENDPNLVAVVCKLCGTLMYAPKADIGKKKQCPDCGLETTIQEPTAEKKKADEIIEPTFTGGYGVDKIPSPEERFYHEPNFLLGKIKTPIEKKLEEERLRQSGGKAAPKPASSSPKSAPKDAPAEPPPIQTTVQPSKRPSARPQDYPLRDPLETPRAGKAPRERFTPETNPATPLFDAVNRRSKRPPLQTTVRQVATPPPVEKPKPRYRSAEEKALAGLAALEKNADSFDGSGLEGFTPTELPQIDTRRKFRRKKGKTRSTKRGKKSANDFNGLIAKINDSGDVVLATPSPPAGTMWTNLFTPLGASQFWCQWAVPLTLGLVAGAILYFIIAPAVRVAEMGGGELVSLGGAMIIVAASVFAAIFTAFALRSTAINFYSTFFALSAGCLRVEEWVEEEWFDGLLTAVRFVAMMTVALIPAIVAQVIGENWPLTLLIGLGSILAFFPMIFLSTMQTDFPVMPMTGTVFASLFRRFGTWCGFYLWSALLIGLPLLGITLLPFGAIQAVCLFFAWIFMPPFYAILLGRLGWVVEDMARD